MDPIEPERVADAAAHLGLKHVVVTSVTRDDLPDGGASAFAAAVEAIRNRLAGVTIEVLTPDFAGSVESLKKVIASKPDVFNHNVETVPRLYPEVRPGADWTRSLNILKSAASDGLVTKSGLMLGMGEEHDELLSALKELRGARCQILTMGQYLAPTRKHRPVARYLDPHEFDRWREEAIGLGFKEVFSAPLVRSSYHAKPISAPS